MKNGWSRPRGYPGVAVLAGAVLLGACASDGAPPGAAAEAMAVDGIPLAERAAIPGWIAFVSERDGQPDVYRMRPSGEEEPLTSGPAADYPAAAAPDGSALLLVRSEAIATGGGDPTHREQILIHALRDGEPLRIGRASTRSRSPSLSPDGKWIVFESDASSFRDLYRIDSSGQGLRRLTDDPEGNFEPVISPDGKDIAFVSSRDGDLEVYRMGAADGGVQRLTHFHRDDRTPRWSPDGEWIAFLSNREGEDAVFLVRRDGTGTRKLTPSARPGGATVAEGDHAWSPDGGHIAYVARDSSGSHLWVAEVETGAQRQLTREPGRYEQPSWSPDGKYLVYTASQSAQEADLYLVRADGSARTRLTDVPGADWLPRWMP